MTGLPGMIMEAVLHEQATIFGQALIILSVVFSVGAFVATMRGSLKALQDHIANEAKLAAEFKAEVMARFDKAERRFECLTGLEVSLAKIDAKLTATDKRVDGFEAQVARLSDEIGELRRSTVWIRPAATGGARQIEGP